MKLFALSFVLFFLDLEVVSHGCVTRDVFGRYQIPELGYQEMPVYRYTLTGDRMVVQVIDYGATIVSVKVPDIRGNIDDIMLGYNTLEGYFSSDNPYFGATIGRVANRIAGGRFILDGVTYNINRNDGNNTLHGGLRGFDKKLWTSRMDVDSVVMEYTSVDQEEGFPGEVKVYVTYTVVGDTLVIKYNATSTKRTPINLTSHNYFNLAGQSAGAEALKRHIVTIKADYITEVNSQFIPTGKLAQVKDTPFDLRQPVVLGPAMAQTPFDGFDYNYVLPRCRGGLVVAIVRDPVSGRQVQVETTQPGLQFYTSNSITSIDGKANYKRHAAFSLEAQNFPDAVNNVEFPNSIIGAGDVYNEVTKYKFGLARETTQ